MQETVISLQQAPDSTSRLMFSAPFLVNHNCDSDLFAERTSRLLVRRAGLKTFFFARPLLVREHSCQLLCFAASNAWLRVDFRRAI